MLPMALPLLGSAPAPAPVTGTGAGAAHAGTAESIHSFFDLSAKLLDGKMQPLAAYRGKVLLVVNTASQCRFTPQYEGLEKLYQAYRARGLVVLAFPSNDFRGREPGTAAEIGTFCRSRYGVSFPIFDKVNTIEPDASQLYRFLAKNHGPPQWNFHKYLVSKDGQVLQSFKSEVLPDAPALLGAIEAALQMP
jgi:glutathione peroxidase